MALLDLQGLEPKPSSTTVKGKKHSGASKGCVIGSGGGGGGSHLSVAFC